MKHPYLNMGVGIYLSYLLLGMVNIVLASNMSFLSERLDVFRTDISLLISVVGIGHLLSINIAGKLSDRYGRKPLLISAAILYAVFLIGVPTTTHFALAMFFALFAGISNSLLDAASYPALNEGFKEAAGTATVLIKAFMSIGAALLPVFIAFLISQDMFFGYAFFLPAIVFIGLGFYFIPVRFPAVNGEKRKEEMDKENVEKQDSNPHSWKEGTAIVLIGFFSVSMTIVIQTWLPTFGQEMIQLNENNAVRLLSFYSVGGLISVLLLAWLLKRIIKPITAMMFAPSVAAIFVFALLFAHDSSLVPFIAFFLGLSTSGIYQLAMTVMIQMFPNNKGVSVSYVSAAASVAFMVIPYITGLLTKHIGISSVFYLELVITIVSTALAFYLSRKIKLFSKSYQRDMNNRFKSLQKF